MADKNCGEKRGLAGRLSLWALFAKGSFYRVLTVALLMAVAETVLLGRILQQSSTAPFEQMIEESRVQFVFLAAFLAVFFLLIRAGRSLDNEGRYTVMRLKVTKTEFFVFRTVYNVLCCLTLFAVQIALVLWFGECYRRMSGTPDTSWMVFLAFYRNRFLHCLMPMAETGKWVRNGLMLLALGMEEAGGAGKRYRTTQAGVFVLSAVWFATPVGLVWQDMVCCLVYVVVIAADLWDLRAACRSGEWIRPDTGTVQSQG